MPTVGARPDFFASAITRKGSSRPGRSISMETPFSVLPSEIADFKSMNV